MKKLPAAILVSVVLAACVKPAIRHDFQNRFTVQRSFDQVWEAVVEAFADANVPIKTIEKQSGIVASENLLADYTSCDCGERGMYTIVEPLARYNVFVKTDGDRVGVTINLTCSATWQPTMGGRNAATIPAVCTSTGRFETQLWTSIYAKTEKAKRAQ